MDFIGITVVEICTLGTIGSTFSPAALPLVLSLVLSLPIDCFAQIFKNFIISVLISFNNSKLLQFIIFNEKSLSVKRFSSTSICKSSYFPILMLGFTSSSSDIFSKIRIDSNRESPNKWSQSTFHLSKNLPLFLISSLIKRK